MTEASPRLVVVDAGVLAQWFLPDEVSARDTLQLMQDVKDRRVVLLAPHLLRYELANIVAVSAARGRLTRDDARMCLEAVKDLNILFGEVDAWEVTRLSLSCGISAYDAQYVALSERHGCLLITTDRKLVRAVRPYSELVRLAGECDASYPSSANRT